MSPYRFRVDDLQAAPGLGGYYADDLTAIRAGAEADGFVYRGRPLTAGHEHIRNPAQAVVIRLRCDSGATGWGDAVAVQYAGFGGREPPIDAAALRPELELAGEGLRTGGELSFFEACKLVEELRYDGRPLHSGLRYGLSQALLALAAHTQGCLPAHVLMESLGERPLMPVPIYAQSGEERHTNVDKMILKDVDVLPHGLINSPAVFGPGGARFLTYAAWVRDRVPQLGRADYAPVLQFDVYGMLGAETGGDVSAMTSFCEALVEACHPYAVQLESPLYGSDGPGTVRALAELRAALARGGVAVGIVADDWCNTIADIGSFLDAGAADMVQIKMPDLGSITNAVEAIQACRSAGAGVFVGGSCVETDLSARASVQLAVAAGADQLLAKPGMGVDEAMTITRNEMTRVCMP